MSKNIVQLRQPTHGLVGVVRLENALAGIKQMLKLGLNWVKLDVNLTKTFQIRQVDDLEVVLQEQCNLKCNININVKTDLKQSIEAACIFAQFIQKYDVKNIMISSLDYTFLSKLKKIIPEVAVCWQLGECNDLTLAIAKNKGFQAISCGSKGINKQFVVSANQCGILMLFSVNTTAAARKLLEYGALVCTESPKELLR